MKKIVFIVLALVSTSAFANETFTTSLGYTFEKIEFAKLGVSWKAPNGTIWGSVIQELFGQKQAIEACKTIGGTLPSKSDFETLKSYFEIGYSPYFLSYQGEMDLQRLFGETQESAHWFWSSTLYEQRSDYVYAFNFGFGWVDYLGYAIQQPSSPVLTRCIVKP